MTDEGTFSGMASFFGVVDLQDDVVDPGAFTKTVRENPVVPILWQHRSDEVIGQGTLENTPQGLAIDGVLDMDDPVAVKAFSKLRKNLIRGLSIGFETVKADMKGGIRHLTEIKMWEVSIVTFPALPIALVDSVKAIERREAELREASDRRVQAMLDQLKELLRAR